VIERLFAGHEQKTERSPSRNRRHDSRTRSRLRFI
jgi:hypothetical protein